MKGVSVLLCMVKLLKLLYGNPHIHRVEDSKPLVGHMKKRKQQQQQQQIIIHVWLWSITF